MKIVRVGSTKIAGHPASRKKAKQIRQEQKQAQAKAIEPKPRRPKRPPIDTTKKQQLADRMRANPTKSEKIVRDELTKAGYIFEFQYVLHGYIPDFYFPNERKIVELDGKCHKKAYDDRRDGHFNQQGIKTHRIPSRWVFTNLPKVLSSIARFINK